MGWAWLGRAEVDWAAMGKAEQGLAGMDWIGLA